MKHVWEGTSNLGTSGTISYKDRCGGLTFGRAQIRQKRIPRMRSARFDLLWRSVADIRHARVEFPQNAYRACIVLF